MKKRMISLVLALAMCLSLCAAVFAEGPVHENAADSDSLEAYDQYVIIMNPGNRSKIRQEISQNGATTKDIRYGATIDNAV